MSDIKIEREDSTKDNPLLDYSNDGFGPKLGLFIKDNVKRPGLCSVTVAEENKVRHNCLAKDKSQRGWFGFWRQRLIFFGGVLMPKG